MNETSRTFSVNATNAVARARADVHLLSDDELALDGLAAGRVLLQLGALGLDRHGRAGLARA